MEEQVPESSQIATELGEQDANRLLLQYLLLHRGSCDEGQLLKALKTLEVKDLNATEWQNRLNKWMASVNLTLNALDYKVSRLRNRSGGWSYVYVDLAPAEDTKGATRLNLDELNFVQWAIQRFLGDRSAIQARGSKSSVENAVDGILREKFGSSEFESLQLRLYHTSGSTELCQYEEMDALKVEYLLARLCQLRWFYETAEGRFGLDVRALAELQTYIREKYSVPDCSVCSELALEGIQCKCNENAWHVACLRHFLAHVGTSCPSCGSSLEQAVYMT
ncbi:LAFA_0B02058g1_1 [Lachancea sp. 'fantastica']|nr:LAFA_0B02058g1_1 [Lachancea sp. 'fantastica']